MCALIFCLSVVQYSSSGFWMCWPISAILDRRNYAPWERPMFWRFAVIITCPVLVQKASTCWHTNDMSVFLPYTDGVEKKWGFQGQHRVICDEQLWVRTGLLTASRDRMLTQWKKKFHLFPTVEWLGLEWTFKDHLTATPLLWAGFLSSVVLLMVAERVLLLKDVLRTVFIITLGTKDHQGYLTWNLPWKNLAWRETSISHHQLTSLRSELCLL